MAFYVFEFNVPMATPEITPVVLEKEIVSPLLQQVSIIIPNGHAGLVRIRVETIDRPIIPTIGSDPPWIRGDGNTVTVTPGIALPGPRWVLRFLGWNADALNDHAFILTIQCADAPSYVTPS